VSETGSYLISRVADYTGKAKSMTLLSHKSGP